MVVFQSTRPRGARPISAMDAQKEVGFNPRAHGGRDPITSYNNDNLKVSIHAPTGGATGRYADAQGQPACFNPRAHGGRDTLCRRRNTRRSGFNPRAHGGRDFKSTQEGARKGSFNPRAHGGRDLTAWKKADDRLVFQSTRPRGARHAPPCSRSSRQEGFNPRAHGGRDQLAEHRPGQLGVSIHAPPVGATGQRARIPARHRVSIHAPTGGATSTPSSVYRSTWMFQSTRPRGARPFVNYLLTYLLVSIHAPTGGAT